MPVRDETGRFIGVRPKTAAERAQVRPPSCFAHHDGLYAETQQLCSLADQVPVHLAASISSAAQM